MCVVIVVYGLNSFLNHILDSYENLMKMMNQKKKRQANQDCHDQGEKNPKKAKNTSQKKQAREMEGTDEDEIEKNRKEQEREAKKRKREEEKKKREAKQQQRKEQLLALQKQHQIGGKDRSPAHEGSSDSDDEYLPIIVDEGFTDSEQEENVHVVSKQPRKTHGTSAPRPSPPTNPNCTWQTPPPSTNLSFPLSRINNP